jgi:hypothetical protein
MTLDIGNTFTIPNTARGTIDLESTHLAYISCSMPLNIRLNGKGDHAKLIRLDAIVRNILLK